MPQLKKRTLRDLINRPEVRLDSESNPFRNNGVATLHSMGTGTEEGEMLLPTVRHGLNRTMNPEEAFKHYLKTGEHLGVFDTIEESNAEGKRLSREQYDIGQIKKSPGAEGMLRALMLMQKYGGL